MIRRIYLISSLLSLVMAAQVPETKNTEPEAVLFDTPPAVETASLYTQTLQEAPANVTVITEQQIRTFGYRTLAEALSNVRGFFFSSEGALQYAGVRGFALPGDYNTRILVLLNGHYLTDNVYGAMYMFGQDLGIDMDLVQRIEVVRGPTSALYGSNGMFATVNIFTRSPADAARGMISTELGSFGQKKMLLSAALYLGRGANLLVAGSGFREAGRSIEARELGGLRADNVEAEHGYHTFAQLTWKNWSVTANFSDRKIIVPMGWYGSDYGDPGTSSRDAHNYVEGVYTKAIGESTELRWRASYDQYHYFGRYDSTTEGVTWDNRDWALGDWVGSQLSVARKTDRFGTLAVGLASSVDFRALQRNTYIVPEFILDIDREHLNRSYGLFGHFEKAVSKRWVLFAGLRFDDTKLDPAFFSPKLAGVFKQSATTTYKLMYGRSFRNPSTFERYWEPNLLLQAEKMNTFEVSREQRIANRVDLIATVFHYKVDGLIEGVPIDDATLQYRNVSTSRATGFEFEASGKPARWLEMAGSFSLHDAKYLPADTPLPNSPERLVQVRASVPLLRNRLTLSAATRALSSRLTPTSARVGSVFLADATATTNRLHPNFDVQFGIRNIANTRYSDPLSAEHLIATFPRAGRTVFFKLIWKHAE